MNQLKCILSFIYLFFFCQIINGQVLSDRTEKEAKTIAQKFLKNLGFSKLAQKLKTELYFFYPSDIEKIAMYKFSAKNEGFVIVVADSRIRPVWAYSTEGTYNMALNSSIKYVYDALII